MGEEDDEMPHEFSTSLFWALVQKWSLPTYAAAHLISSAADSMVFELPVEANGPGRISLLGPSTGADVASVSMYEPHSRTFCAFLESNHSVKEIKDWLEKGPEAIVHPGLFVLLLCEQSLEAEIRSLRSAIIRISAESEVFEDLDSRERITAREKITRGVNDDSFIRSVQLTTEALQTISHFFEGTGHVETSVAALKEFTEKVCIDRQAGEMGSVLPATLSRRIHGLEARVSKYKAKAAFCQARGQIILQTASWIVGVQDNQNNLKATEAAMAIATESRRIAEDSKEIAMLTRRDSNDMRVIAAVTLLFLPGTFVATLFSATFLDFLAEEGSTRISGLGLGIYWVVTITLTLLVLGSWITLSRKRNAKDAEKCAAST